MNRNLLTDTPADAAVRRELVIAQSCVNLHRKAMRKRAREVLRLVLSRRITPTAIACTLICWAARIAPMQQVSVRRLRAMIISIIPASAPRDEHLEVLDTLARHHIRFCARVRATYPDEAVILAACVGFGSLTRS